MCNTLLLLLILLAAHNAQCNELYAKRIGYISTFAGTSQQNNGDGHDAMFAAMSFPKFLSLDATNQLLYVADTVNNRIRVIDLVSNQITTVAGNGNLDATQDKLVAQYTSLNLPFGVAIDIANEQVFIADTNNHRIRAVDKRTGIITTVAGTGVGNYSGDSLLATTAMLYLPTALAYHATWRVLFIADSENYRIRMLNMTSNKIETIAGNGKCTYFGDGVLATSASLCRPYGISLDEKRNILYIADSFNHRIRQVDLYSKIITTIAGDGVSRFNSDNVVATRASLSFPIGITYANEKLYIADRNNQRIRMLNVTTIPASIATIAGNGRNGFAGDGNAATTASLNFPYSVVPHNNDLYIADFLIEYAKSRDNSLAASAVLSLMLHVAIDSVNDQVYVTDSDNHQIRVVNRKTNAISTFAGNGQDGFSGDGNLAKNASMSYPYGLCIDVQNNMVYIADTENNRIRAVNRTSNEMFTIAGTGIASFSGDNALAISATLNYPFTVALDGEQQLLYVADAGNHRIRVINLQTRIITTVAGNGKAAFAGDGLVATNASLNSPFGIVVDEFSNLLYIADTENNRIRVVNRATALISTFVGNGKANYAGDGKPLSDTSVALNRPYGIAIDNVHNLLYIADSDNQRIRVIDRQSNIITTFVGNEKSGFTGDGALSTIASLRYPVSIAIDSLYQILYVADQSGRIRKITGITCNIGASGPECEYCSYGMYSDRIGSKQCTPCSTGYYSTIFGANSSASCLPCESGTFSITLAANSNATCQFCNAGTFSLRGANNCTICPENTYSTQGSHSCTACNAGYTSKLGSTSCELAISMIWIIVLGISALFLFLVLIGTVCCGCLVRRVRKSKDTELHELLLTNYTDVQELPLSFDSSLFQIPFEELSHFEELSNGGSGALVLKGQWKKQMVVVKLVRLDTLCENMSAEQFANEIQLSMSLRAKNIVFFFGACIKLPRIGLVLEYCSNGTLKQYLTKNNVPWRKRYDLLLEIAQGLAFLHSKGVIHRDMKGDNVLIDDDLHAKIADFGIATTQVDSVHKTKHVGTSYYIAPEVTLGEQYNEKCDIFSLAMIMFEIVTCNFYPFGKHTSVNIEYRISVEESFRPVIPNMDDVTMSDASHSLVIDLMKQCWQRDPSKRPSAAQIVETLTSNYSLLYIN